MELRMWLKTLIAWLTVQFQTQTTITCSQQVNLRESAVNQEIQNTQLEITLTHDIYKGTQRKNGASTVLLAAVAQCLNSSCGKKRQLSLIPLTFRLLTFYVLDLEIRGLDRAPSVENEIRTRIVPDLSHGNCTRKKEGLVHSAWGGILNEFGHIWVSLVTSEWTCSVYKSLFSSSVEWSELTTIDLPLTHLMRRKHNYYPGVTTRKTEALRHGNPS
jgi:hypothetical protein